MKVPAALRRTPLSWAVPAAWVAVQAAGLSALAVLHPHAGWWPVARGTASAAWGHAGWGHLAANLVLWAVYAPVVEARCGRRFVVVLVAGQAAGVAAHLAGGGGALVGGSFLVAACLGGYLAAPGRDRRRTAVAVVVLAAEAALAAGGAPSTSSHWGHTAAAAAGALAVLALGRASARKQNCGPEGPQSV